MNINRQIKLSDEKIKSIFAEVSDIAKEKDDLLKINLSDNGFCNYIADVNGEIFNVECRFIFHNVHGVRAVTFEIKDNNGNFIFRFCIPLMNPPEHIINSHFVLRKENEKDVCDSIFNRIYNHMISKVTKIDNSGF